MRIALSGTPGTGKFTVGAILAAAGRDVLSVDVLAERAGAWRAFDRMRESREVDLAAIARGLAPGGPSVLTGHLAHLLPVDRAVVLRCHPDRLRRRLERRGWVPSKIQENVEAEAVGIITGESLRRVDTYELDTSASSPQATAGAFGRIRDGRGEQYRAPWVDWSEVILSWY